MGEPVTQQDLERHFERTREANREVVAVLKEVAVQFSTIGNQLLQLAKSNEEIIGALVERVQAPLEQAIKEHHGAIKEVLERELSALFKDLSQNCDKCCGLMVQAKDTLNGIPDVNQELVDEASNRILAALKEGDLKWQKTWDDKAHADEKLKLKGWAKYTLLITALTALLGLLGMALKECLPALRSPVPAATHYQPALPAHLDGGVGPAKVNR